MQRREVLKALLAAPLAGTIGGCIRRPVHPSSTRVLRVVLQGPFAVIFPRNDRNRITAYVPFDDEKLHEFRFQDLTRAESGHRSYQFELRMRGLKPPDRPPYLDRCFDDATVTISKWTADPDDYFVSIDLPQADLITFRPPAEVVTFKNDKRRALMPSNHIFEYRIRDADDVVLNSAQLGSRRPVPCADFDQNYKDYRNTYEKAPGQNSPDHTMSPRLSAPELCRYENVHTYFLGVGLPWDTKDSAKKDHALNFFNSRLLPSLHDAKALLEKELSSIDNNDPKGQNSNGSISTPRLIGAVWRPSAQQPHYRTISSIEDCKAPAINAVIT